MFLKALLVFRQGLCLFYDSMPYTIRPALPSDLPRLPPIEQAAATLFHDTAYGFLTAGDPVPFETLVENQHTGRVWVAVWTETDVPVGFAVATLMHDHPHLQEMDVLPDHSRNGLGTRLVDAVCDWAIANNYPWLTLTTFRDIPWNAPFYQRLGFEIVPSADWTPGLRAVMQAEAATGLPVADRVVMRKMLG